MEGVDRSGGGSCTVVEGLRFGEVAHLIMQKFWRARLDEI